MKVSISIKYSGTGGRNDRNEWKVIIGTGDTMRVFGYFSFQGEMIEKPAKGSILEVSEIIEAQGGSHCQERGLPCAR
ncbi:MAG: hypothetical protein KJ625_08560 [Actinobacteria bacterium]|nr:hypothetical protein [Actinomycetota bacterium]